MRRISFSHSDFNALNLTSFSTAQLQVSTIETSFSREACNWRSLTGMMAGGLAFRMGRLAALESFSSLGLMRNAFMTPALRALAFTGALAGEVTVFRGVNQIFSPEIISPEQSFLNPQNWMSTFVDFLSLKTFAPLGAQNIFLGNVSQNLGMMAGHRATSLMGLSRQEEGSFAQQFFHASATNLQMGLGIVLGLRLTGSRLQSLERSIESHAARVSDMSLAIQPRLLQTMHDPNSVQSQRTWKIPTEVLGVNIEDPSVTFGEVWYSYRTRNSITIQSFCRSLKEKGMSIKGDTVDVYRKFPDRVVDPNLLKGIHLVYGEDYQNLVYLASRHHLSTPQAHALAVTAEGPLCLYPHWMPLYLNRIASAGRRPHSLQYRILEALTKTPGARKAEEIVSGTTLNKDQLLKYLGGINAPEPDKIPEVAKALRMSEREVIEGINEDYGFTPMLDRLGMRRDIYFVVRGQSADADFLKEFSDLGIPALRNDLRAYMRYRLWRAHKECGGGYIGWSARSLSWKGKDHHFLTRYLADSRPFSTEHLKESADLFRRLDQDPLEIFAPYCEELRLSPNEFLIQIGIPENLSNLLSVLLASKAERRATLIGQVNWPESFRDIFPEAFSESDACLVLDTEDINAACSPENLSSLGLKASLLRTHPEVLLIFPLKNSQTGKKFRIHVSRLASLFSVLEDLNADIYNQAPGIRAIDEKARLAEIKEKIGTWNNRTGKTLERYEEEDLCFIWRYSEAPTHREKAQGILLAAYRHHIYKLTLNSLCHFKFDISKHLDTALNEAILGFGKALRRYNSDLGIRFMTYILHEQNWIRANVDKWCIKEIRRKDRQRRIVNAEKIEHETRILKSRSGRNFREELSVDPGLNLALLIMKNWLQTQKNPDLWQAIFEGRFMGDEFLDEIGTEHGVSKSKVQYIEAQIRVKAQRVFAQFRDQD